MAEELHQHLHRGPLSDGAGIVSVPAGDTLERSRRRAGERGLHICPECCGRLVYPTDWAEAGSADWEVTLRCPECEWSDTGIFDQALVEEFDVELDRGVEELMNDLRQLSYANMYEDVERFAAALQADAILPFDF